jgi:hypothetical protein
MLKLCCRTTISCQSCPVVRPRYALSASYCKYWFCRKRFKMRGIKVVWNKITVVQHYTCFSPLQWKEMYLISMDTRNFSNYRTAQGLIKMSWQFHFVHKITVDAKYTLFQLENTDKGRIVKCVLLYDNSAVARLVMSLWVLLDANTAWFSARKLCTTSKKHIWKLKCTTECVADQTKGNKK